jgi:hypothetical protein
VSEKGDSFLRPLKNKGFRKERMMKVRLDALGKSRTLESNKSLKKKIFQTPRLSSLGQFGWQAAEREYFFRCMSKLEQCLLDLLSQGLKSRKVVQVGVLLFDCARSQGSSPW